MGLFAQRSKVQKYLCIFELCVFAIQPRLRVRSRRLLLSIGAGEAVKKPSNPTQIEQVDGVFE